MRAVHIVAETISESHARRAIISRCTIALLAGTGRSKGLDVAAIRTQPLPLDDTRRRVRLTHHRRRRRHLGPIALHAGEHRLAIRLGLERRTARMPFPGGTR